VTDSGVEDLDIGRTCFFSQVTRPISHTPVRQLRLRPLLSKSRFTDFIVAIDQNDSGLIEATTSQSFPDERDSHLSFE
jgi:hypothetical protein